MSETQKHTPGPWVVAGRTIQDGSHRTLARLTDNEYSGYDCPPPAEATANGRFIVRAVNAHAALRNLALWMMRDDEFIEANAERGNEIGSAAFERELIEAARAALKAGE
jgi:hypothetical protein